MNVIVKNRTLLVEIGESRENGLYISTVYDENQHGDPRDHGYSLPDIELDPDDEEELLKLLLCRRNAGAKERILTLRKEFDTPQWRKTPEGDIFWLALDIGEVMRGAALDAAYSKCREKYSKTLNDLANYDKPFVPECTPQEAAEKFTRDNPAIISIPRPKATAFCNQCNGVGSRGFAGRCRKCNGTGVVEV